MKISDGQLHTPFFLKPVGKDYLWGGTRLNDDFAKGMDLDPLAESWECSTHPDGLTLVGEPLCGSSSPAEEEADRSGTCPSSAGEDSSEEEGTGHGLTLRELLREHPEAVGTHPLQTVREAGLPEGSLPILIKFIDAKQDLSVQVHPDDAYARAHEHGSLGKSEMWYVVDASKDAHLIYGFRHDMDREKLRRALSDGTVEKYLQKVPVHKGDIFYIEAGTVHAICAGALVVEVQESSNLTYRLYDYRRVDRNGRERELHVDKGLAVANLKGSSEPRQPMRVLRYTPGLGSEFLCRCRYFEVEHLLLNTERIRGMAGFKTDSDSFQVLVCTDGCGVLGWEDTCRGSSGEAEDTLPRGRDGGPLRHMLPFFRGDTIFVPADSVPVRIHGTAQFLKIRC